MDEPGHNGREIMRFAAHVIRVFAIRRGGSRRAEPGWGKGAVARACVLVGGACVANSAAVDRMTEPPPVRLLLEEMFFPAVAAELRGLGHDVIAVAEPRTADPRASRLAQHGTASTFRHAVVADRG